MERSLLQETLRVLRQSGNRVSLPRDRGRLAQTPGKRVSRTGHVYWETRKNRSDETNKRI